MIPLAEMSPACDVAVKGLASTMTAQDNTGSDKIGATLIRKIHADAEMHKQDWIVLKEKRLNCTICTGVPKNASIHIIWTTQV